MARRPVEYLNKLHRVEQDNWRINFSRHVDFWIKDREEQQSALQRRYSKSASNGTDIREGDMFLIYCPAKDKLTSYRSVVPTKSVK